MNSSRVIRASVLLASVWVAVAARADDQPQRAELLVFGSAEARGFEDQPPLHSDDLLLTADFLGNWNSGRWHALAEVLLSTEEQEIERLQFGWEPVADTFLWIGRFHQPGSVWNTREHHGQYLQPSITRPSIEDWEDGGGVLPQHIEGLLFETRRPLRGDRAFALSTGVGISARLNDGALDPMDVLDPHRGSRKMSYSLQAALLPDFASDDSIGLVASHNELALAPAPGPAGSGQVNLSVLGAFLDLGRGPWQLTATAYAVEARFAGAIQAPPDRFDAGYLQLQRRFDTRLTLLARIEATRGTGNSPYLALLSGWIKQRLVADLRWDFAPRQALAIEVADSDAPAGDFREVRIQWSAALP